jgi:CheY-like chemotaxis protein
MRSPGVIVIDDEPAVGEFIERVARLCGFAVEAVSTGEAFKRLIEAQQPDVIVMDLCMPGCDGVELLSFLADRSSSAAIIIMSGVDRRVLDTAERLGRARGLRISGAISKPVRAADLRRQLMSAAQAA